jgi:hypothetical protein
LQDRCDSAQSIKGMAKRPLRYVYADRKFSHT